MDCQAAVLTAKGASALATVQVSGADAVVLLAKVLSTPPPQQSQVVLCRLLDKTGVIDQITIGHEAPNTFALHCHGNPLIVQRIVRCLQDQGATIVAPPLTAGITLEQELEQGLAKTKTLFGARLLAQQRRTGLLPLAKQWIQQTTLPLPEIQVAARDMLTRYLAGSYAIHGCTVALVGPPNSGKSTLFNHLLGAKKSIVADVHGTTRDWIEGELTLDDLHLRLIDTAGLNPALTQSATGHLDRCAQDQVPTLLDGADFYLLVLDIHETAQQMQSLPLEQLTPENTLVLLNKDDLSHQLPLESIQHFHHTLPIRALHDVGLTEVLDTLRTLTGVNTLDLTQPTPFTPRQQTHLNTLATSTDPNQALLTLQKLLQG